MESQPPGLRSGRSAEDELVRLRHEVAELKAVLSFDASTHNAMLKGLAHESINLLSVFGQAPVGISVVQGPNHIFTLANPKYLSLFGGRQDFIGKSVKDAVPEAAEQGFIELLDRVYSTGVPFHGTETAVELVQPDGEIKKLFLNFSYQPLRDRNESIQGILTIVNDVTEQVLDRAKLEESERKVRTLIESLPQLVWTCKADGECDYLSSQWFDYTGASPGKLAKMEWVESMIHPDDRRLVWDRWSGALGGKHEYDLEYRIRRYDGAYRWFKTRAIPVKDASGGILSWFGTCTDIHDTKEAEEKLAVERAQLETIFQKSPAAMVLWRGPELIFDKINPGYQAIFTDRELLGKPFAEALPETKGQPFEDWIKHVFETGETKVQPEMLAKLVLYRGGPVEDRYFDMSFVQVMGANNQPYGVYEHAVDVTDRVLSRRSMEKSKADLEITVKSLEQEREIRERFVATLTHDLRTPLTAAKMSAQLLHRKLSDTEGLQRLTVKIVDHMDRADEMIRDLLDANLIRAGEKLPIEIGRCQLNTIVDDTVAELSTVHGERFIISANQSIEGQWSESALRRILENLCSNAIKYGASQRPVEITLFSSDEHIGIEVKNEGNPIPIQDQKSLFEPFHRSSSAKAGGEKGWGLGLTLVKGLAEAHGGSISMQSSHEIGTIFRVTIPHDAKLSATN